MPDSTEGIQVENVDPIELRLGITEGKLACAKMEIDRLRHLLKVKQLMLDEMTEACRIQCEMIDQLRERFPVDSDYQSTN